MTLAEQARRQAHENVDDDRINSEMTRITNRIMDAAQMGRFSMSRMLLDMTPATREQLIRRLRDEGFQVNWDARNQTVNVSW